MHIFRIIPVVFDKTTFLYQGIFKGCVQRIKEISIVGHAHIVNVVIGLLGNSYITLLLRSKLNHFLAAIKDTHQ